MIQEFTVKNFLSYKEKVTLNFEATKDKKLLEELTIEPKKGVKLLKSIIIYGANASGKSNLLRAIEILWMLLISPAEDKNEAIELYYPFELTNNEPTYFEIIFWIKDIKFKYQVEYNSTNILYEKNLNIIFKQGRFKELIKQLL